MPRRGRADGTARIPRRRRRTCAQEERRYRRDRVSRLASRSRAGRELMGEAGGEPVGDTHRSVDLSRPRRSEHRSRTLKHCRSGKPIRQCDPEKPIPEKPIRSRSGADPEKPIRSRSGTPINRRSEADRGRSIRGPHRSCSSRTISAGNKAGSGSQQRSQQIPSKVACEPDCGDR